jgi:hypothetical protein
MLKEYSYYPGGQRETMTENGITDLYTYNLDGALMAAGDVIYTSDNNGNRTSMTIGLETTEYAFSFDNELSEVTYPDLSTAQYYYSAIGEQIKKLEYGLISFSQYAGSQLLTEYDASGITTFYYNPGLSITGGPSTGYYYYNGYGSTTMQMDQNQSIMANEYYDFFGMSTESSGTWMNNRNEFSFMISVLALDLYFGSNLAGDFIYDPATDINLVPDPDPAKSEPKGKKAEEDKKIEENKKKAKKCPLNQLWPVPIGRTTIPWTLDNNSKKSNEEGDKQNARNAHRAKAEDACEDHDFCYKKECPDCDPPQPICYGILHDVDVSNPKDINGATLDSPAICKCVCLTQAERDRRQKEWNAKKYPGIPGVPGGGRG